MAYAQLTSSCASSFCDRRCPARASSREAGNPRHDGRPPHDRKVRKRPARRAPAAALHTEQRAPCPPHGCERPARRAPATALHTAEQRAPRTPAEPRAPLHAARSRPASPLRLRQRVQRRTPGRPDQGSSALTMSSRLRMGAKGGSSRATRQASSSRTQRTRYCPCAGSSPRTVTSAQSPSMRLV